MKITREFASTDRYVYDFKVCTSGNGFSQIDTESDASYYGEWANPFKLIHFSYVEGDCTTVECENEQEFVEHIRETVDWHVNRNDGRCKIDGMCNEKMIARWKELGLGDLLH